MMQSGGERVKLLPELPGSTAPFGARNRSRGGSREIRPPGFQHLPYSPEKVGGFERLLQEMHVGCRHPVITAYFRPRQARDKNHVQPRVRVEQGSGQDV